MCLHERLLCSREIPSEQHDLADLPSRDPDVWHVERFVLGDRELGFVQALVPVPPLRKDAAAMGATVAREAPESPCTPACPDPDRPFTAAAHDLQIEPRAH